MRLPTLAALPQVQTLPPASFAFVMATGILAVDAWQQGLAGTGRVLLALGAVAWGWLWLLTLARAVRHPQALWDDLRDHQRAPGFFTAVAGTGVLAGGCVVLQVSVGAAAVLATLTGLLWLVLTYGILLALITKADKPALDRGIHGGWLLAVVASQSVAVGCALLSPLAAQPLRLELNVAALCLWLFAGALYTWIIGLIFYRYLFFRLERADLTPASWINMGAMAISTLAGTLLVAHAAEAPLLLELRPFVKGFTLLYWATATWWLPLLLALVAWRHWRTRPPGPTLAWSAVFPLGMYAAATHGVAAVLSLPALAPVATVFFWVAALAWLATLVASARG